MINLLLPGTSVIYYGDEIGMSNSTLLSWSQIQDPYTLTYCDISNYQDQCICRDPSRTPMQWTNGSNAGFTSANHTWLPVAVDYDVYNVQAQQDLYLATFKNITKLRQMDAFQKGRIYYPYHDWEIFSFLRKSDDDDMAYMVVVRLGPVPTDDDGPDHDHRVIDFTNIVPGFPEQGILEAASDLTDQDHEHPIG